MKLSYIPNTNSIMLTKPCLTRLIYWFFVCTVEMYLLAGFDKLEEILKEIICPWCHLPTGWEGEDSIITALAYSNFHYLCSNKTGQVVGVASTHSMHGKEYQLTKPCSGAIWFPACMNGSGMSVSQTNYKSCLVFIPWFLHDIWSTLKTNKHITLFMHPNSEHSLLNWKWCTWAPVIF